MIGKFWRLWTGIFGERGFCHERRHSIRPQKEPSGRKAHTSAKACLKALRPATGEIRLTVGKYLCRRSRETVGKYLCRRSRETVGKYLCRRSGRLSENICVTDPGDCREIFVPQIPGDCRKIFVSQIPGDCREIFVSQIWGTVGKRNLDEESV